MNMQFLLIYWSISGLVVAAWAYYEFTNCTGKDRDELEDLLWRLETYYEINAEMALWIIVAFELILGGIILPIMIFNRLFRKDAR